MELTGWSRQKSSLVNLFLIIALSLPCVLGYNVWAWDGFAIFGGAVLDLEDFLVSNLFLPLGSLVYLLFCVTRYGWGWDNYKKEVNTGDGLKVQDWMRGYLTYGLPSSSCSSLCLACTTSSSPDQIGKRPVVRKSSVPRVFCYMQKVPCSHCRGNMGLQSVQLTSHTGLHRCSCSRR